MDFFGIPIRAVVEAAVGTIAVVSGVILGIGQLKERRARKANGLKGNPTRCAIHEERIKSLEDGQALLREGQAGLKATVDGIDGKVDKLLTLHLEK